MLNITENSIKKNVNEKELKAYQEIQGFGATKKFNRIFFVIFALILIVMFLPWTQNVRGMGEVTTFLPSQRPQTLQSPIPGRIQQWFVREGDTVSAGDTIVFISELNNEFFDPEIVMRTKEQLAALEEQIVAYGQKLAAMDDILRAMVQNRDIKLLQTKLRIEADSVEVENNIVRQAQAKLQLDRAKTLLEEGINSQFDFEQRNQAMQEANARYQAAKTRYDNSITDYQAVIADFNEKESKLRSDQFTVQTQRLESQQKAAQLRTRLAGIEVRQGFYFLTAPQRGMITRTYVSGIGENIKEGQALAQLMPLDYQMAAEIYVRPVDLPLIKIGQRAQLEFDGWPAIVFSGWPNTSFGTFPAKVVAVDNVAEGNGYRILVVPYDDEERLWPEQLRFGSGVNGILLLNDVPVWYELWRQINGFPPEYYTGKRGGMDNGKK
ncbi:MAG: HlyD family secretion protein [Schleiferiaceae bacterium]|nr:HlyD family secretion protein [Schleiferiaceae bacterium]